MLRGWSILEANLRQKNNAKIVEKNKILTVLALCLFWTIYIITLNRNGELRMSYSVVCINKFAIVQ